MTLRMLAEHVAVRAVSLFLISFTLNVCVGQNAALKRGDAHYEDLSFYEAALSYELAFVKGASDVEHMRKLAHCYLQIREAEDAAIWYKKVLKSAGVQNDDYLHYAQVLKMNGKYQESDTWMAKYAQLNATDNRAEALSNSTSVIESLLHDGLFKASVKPLSSNTITADWSPSLMNGQLVISSSRTSDMSFKNYHGWDGKAFMDLYVGDLTEKGDAPKLQPFNRKINTKYHESNPCFNSSGNVMYFTRNNLNGKYLGRSSTGVNNLQIYKSVLKKGKWRKARSFEFNSPEWSSGHPSLSPSGDQLYFVSDKPGGYGGSDIYVCVKQSDGSWGEPKNLGARINTEGNEMSPFLHSDGTLFFASDGHQGLGGMDIFLSLMRGIEPGEVMNVGAPINSRFDELSLVLLMEGNAGYFSSNREGGAGDDDVYRADLAEVFDREAFYRNPIELEIEEEEIEDLSKVFSSSRKISTITRDATTGKVIQGVELMFDEQLRAGVAAIKGTSNNEGFIELEVPKERDKNNDLILVKSGYLPKLITSRSIKSENAISSVSQFDVLMTPVKKGVDLGAAMGIDPVYFEVEKWDITPEAALQLKRIAFILKTEPSINIELGSHTDSQGSAGFNDLLSNMRAEASKEFLIACGIEESRIDARGYGESNPVNRCADGVRCSEEEHQMNRRTEFIVQSKN